MFQATEPIKLRLVLDKTLRNWKSVETCRDFGRTWSFRFFRLLFSWKPIGTKLFADYIFMCLFWMQIVCLGSNRKVCSLTTESLIPIGCPEKKTRWSDKIQALRFSWKRPMDTFTIASMEQILKNVMFYEFHQKGAFLGTTTLISKPYLYLSL